MILVIPERSVSTTDASALDRGRFTSPTITIPERRAPYDGTEHWPQSVVSQTPPAGVEVTAGATVTLVGGSHPASDAARPWLWQHQQAVKSKGAAPCLECHPESYCSNCHVAVTKRDY